MTPDTRIGQKPGTPEDQQLPSFIEKAIEGSEPAWCVDGRPDLKSIKGSQMLGASLHPVILKAIDKDLNFDEALVSKALPALASAGFGLGVHWGAHKHEGASDCGFADRMPEIIEKAQNEKEKITNRLLAVYRKNQPVFQSLELSETRFSQLLQQAYEKISVYPSAKIQLKGEALIDKAINLGAAVENLAGDHQELAAFVNLREGVTLDTNRLNQQGNQAFNLDLWMVLKQTNALGVNKDFALAASLIFYQATEMVLVEDKGKIALPVILHS